MHYSTVQCTRILYPGMLPYCVRTRVEKKEKKKEPVETYRLSTIPHLRPPLYNVARMLKLVLVTLVGTAAASSTDSQFCNERIERATTTLATLQRLANLLGGERA